MNPLVITLVQILTAYASKKLTGALENVGKHVLDKIRNYMKGNEKLLGYLNDFLDDPDTYEKPITKELESAIQESPQLRNELELLVNQYSNLSNQVIHNNFSAEASGNASQTNVSITGNENKLHVGDIVTDHGRKINVSGDYIEHIDINSDE